MTKQIGKEINYDFRFSVIIFILAFFQFANTLQHDFAWDDKIVITENSRVQKGIKGIPELFLKYNTNQVADGYGYRPIVLMAFAIEYQLWGMNAKGGHFMNVLYFSILCLVLYKFLRKIFIQYSAIFPLLVCILFIVHPLHVEVVANIKSRDEIFALLFSLLSLGHIISYSQSLKIKYLVFSILTFFLAFLSKESAFMFLLVMPLTILYINNWKISKPAIITSASVIAISVICLLIVYAWRHSSLGYENAVVIGNYHDNNLMGNSFFHTHDISIKIANALTVMMLYVKNYFYPLHLVHYTGYNQIPVGNWADVLVIVSLLFHTSLIAIAIVKIKTHPIIFYSLIFYLITIAFYTHLALPLADTMADRFFFAPSVPFSILFVYVFCVLFKIDLKANETNTNENFSLKPMLNKGWMIALIFLFFSIKTFSRNKIWKDGETLLIADMPDLENCAQIHFFYANMLRQKLMKTGDMSLEPEMVHHYKRSIEITDSSYFAYMGLGTHYVMMNKIDEGIALLKSRQKIYPNNMDVNNYLGDAYLKKNDYLNAILYLKKSCDISTNISSANHSLSLAYAKVAQFDDAYKMLKVMENRTGINYFVCDGYSKVYFEQSLYLFNKKIKNELEIKTIESLIEKSTSNALKSIDYGANPSVVYTEIISHYKSINDLDDANKYLNIAKSMNIQL